MWSQATAALGTMILIESLFPLIFTMGLFHILFPSLLMDLHNLKQNQFYASGITMVFSSSQCGRKLPESCQP
jgi:hypothetical protein